MHRKLDTSVRNMTGTVTANWSKGMLCQELKQASKICNQYSLYACEHFRKIYKTVVRLNRLERIANSKLYFFFFRSRTT